MDVDFQNSDCGLASQEAAQKFEREDWSLFRTVEGLQQRAGVPKRLLPQLVIKELVDNGLDNGSHVQIETITNENEDVVGYAIEDDGAGIDGTPENIARLFSIARPMVSTKLLRLPTRGALGNGLRVVAGAVLSSGGLLTVTTRNRRIELRSERDGTTTVLGVENVEVTVGTRVEIRLGPALAFKWGNAVWGLTACQMAGCGERYLGKSSPWWYDVDQFHELLFASGNRPVRELIANLDGCSGGKAGKIVAEAGLGRSVCRDVTAAEAANLLRTARNSANPVNPKRLGSVGPLSIFTAHAIAYGETNFGAVAPQAEIPFVVEAWAKESYRNDITVCVNRTPITGSVHVARNKREINAFGCGLQHHLAKAPANVQFDIRINITTPYMPITSDGKAPDLLPFFDEIEKAVGRVVRQAHRPESGPRVSQKDVVLDNLDDVINEVSGGGRYRFNQRQLLYKLRPIVQNELGQELSTTNFAAIITDYEAENGEIPGMYREPRGTIYHPHRCETITLGDLMVEDYTRPIWTYNKLVYIEKEGFSEALKDDRWAERHDCALMSSKGYTTRAARDLVDLLIEHDEPVTIFCVHDADAFGTMIHQTFQDATRARGARKVKIVNLGLEPWEAIAMGLEVETVSAGDRRKPVADYVDLEPCGAKSWSEWLQTHRVELNAMSTPQFIQWLDAKMAGYDKLIPPGEAIESELDKAIEAKVRAAITARILREAGFEAQVASAVAAIRKPDQIVLEIGIHDLFRREPDREWRDHIEAVAAELTVNGA
jgi:hypothetical protein